MAVENKSGGVGNRTPSIPLDEFQISKYQLTKELVVAVACGDSAINATPHALLTALTKVITIGNLLISVSERK